MKLIDILKQKNISFEVNAKGHISVGGGLVLRGCTGLTSLPDNLSVGGGLDLEGCEHFENVAFKKKCGRQNRTIFAAWVNGEVSIGAGCFLGSIDKFYNAVDESYSGEAAAKYKADADECVRSLVKKLNRE